MITCPMCKKRLRGMEKECLNCKADVSLLVDYVTNLRDGLARAEAYTRAGELGDAVWAYLAVLEVDPDNAAARRQVGKVATAVRQFDETAPGRRWLTKLHKQKRFRRWLANFNESGQGASLAGAALWFLVILGALIIGYMIGVQNVQPANTGEPPGQSAPEDKEKKDRKEQERKPAETLGKPDR
jgi:hypothetical protein